jgi:hypothetical protein
MVETVGVCGWRPVSAARGAGGNVAERGAGGKDFQGWSRPGAKIAKAVT